MKLVHELSEAIEEMQETGVTHHKLRNKYHLTEYGARKFADMLSTDYEELDNRGMKLFKTDKKLAELDRDTRHEPIPVSNNYATNMRETQHAKSSRTQEAKEFAMQIEQIAKETEAPTIEWEDSPARTVGGIDVIWHETDTHLGALGENNHGEVIFDSDMAERTMYEKLDAFQDYVCEQESFSEIDTIHWLLGGDIVEGTGIYQGQAHELDMNINEQIYKGGEMLITLAKDLVNLAEHVDAELQIVCVPGNHGDMRVKGASNKANFDDIVYHTLALGLNIYLENHGHEDRVRLKRSDTVIGMSFPIRNHVAYLTHGQHMKAHVGTSSGVKDALGIINEYEADVIFRGHYHMPKNEDVHGVPVVMSPSIKPGGMYEDSMQAYGDTEYAFYTADDKNPIRDTRRRKL